LQTKATYSPPVAASQPPWTPGNPLTAPIVAPTPSHPEISGFAAQLVAERESHKTGKPAAAAAAGEESQGAHVASHNRHPREMGMEGRMEKKKNGMEEAGKGIQGEERQARGRTRESGARSRVEMKGEVCAGRERVGRLSKEKREKRKERKRKKKKEKRKRKRRKEKEEKEKEKKKKKKKRRQEKKKRRKEEKKKRRKEEKKKRRNEETKKRRKEEKKKRRKEEMKKRKEKNEEKASVNRAALVLPLYVQLLLLLL